MGVCPAANFGAVISLICLRHILRPFDLVGTVNPETTRGGVLLAVRHIQLLKLRGRLVSKPLFY